MALTESTTRASRKVGKSDFLSVYELVGAYQNGNWVVGVEEGVDQIGGSCIVAPSGEIVSACTNKGDETTPARCDLDLCKSFKETTFIFDVHRQPEAHRRIVERKGPRLMADGTPVSQAAGQSSS